VQECREMEEEFGTASCRVEKRIHGVSKKEMRSY
jgi:hypothetical protein